MKEIESLLMEIGIFSGQKVCWYVCCLGMYWLEICILFFIKILRRQAIILCLTGCFFLTILIFEDMQLLSWNLKKGFLQYWSLWCKLVSFLLPMSPRYLCVNLLPPGYIFLLCDIETSPPQRWPPIHGLMHLQRWKLIKEGLWGESGYIVILVATALIFSLGMIVS